MAGDGGYGERQSLFDGGPAVISKPCRRSCRGPVDGFMARIQAQVGLISGINYGAMISQLISLDQEPVTLLQDRVANSTEQEAAFSSLSTSLSAIQTIGNSLALPQTFAAATANSSDTNVLTATAGTAASVGSYQFQVERLVSTQQTVGQGFGAPIHPPSAPAR